MAADTRLALVIPTYNYAHGISATLQRLARWQVKVSDIAVDIVFSDDGSQDGTPDTIAQFITEHGLRWRLLHAPYNRGKGAAVREGIFAAYDFAPHIIVFSDCDLHYGLDIITQRMVPLLEEETSLHQPATRSDVVIADRTLLGHDPSLPWVRRVASALFNRFVAVLTGITLKDTQAGLKGFRADECRPLFDVLRLDGFTFDVELLSVAQYHRYRITQIPVTFANPPESHLSSVTLLPATLRMTTDLLRINWNWKQNRYTSAALTERLQRSQFTIHDA